jgi:hypothetical protein
MTDEEIRDFADEFGIDPTEDYYSFDGTLASAQKILKDSQDETAYMYQQYKAGKLDPQPGERGRKEFLEKKLEEAELSGESKIMSRAEREELAAFDDLPLSGSRGGPDESPAFPSYLTRENIDLPPPGSRGGPDDIAAPFVSADETIKNLRIQDPDLANQVRKMVDEGIISTVGNQGGNPAKRATAREFLVEALKKDETDVGTAAFGKTNLNNVISAEDVKYITEGGGGIGGDPLVLVEKYFGPRIRDLVPEGASSEEIIIFTNRVLNNVEDAAGLKPDNPRFDRFTARFVDEVEDFAKGGRVGFQGGGMDASKDDFNTPGSGSYSRSYNPGAGGVVQHGGGNPPSGGGGGDNDPPERAVTFNTVVESQDIPVIDKSIPTVVGLEALLADKGKFKAVFDAEEAAKDLDLSSGAMLSYDGSIGPVDINAMTNLSGDKNLNLGYQTKGGTNIGLETDMGDNAMFKISRTFAKGGLAKILEV